MQLPDGLCYATGKGIFKFGDTHAILMQHGLQRDSRSPKKIRSNSGLRKDPVNLHKLFFSNSLNRDLNKLWGWKFNGLFDELKLRNELFFLLFNWSLLIIIY